MPQFLVISSRAPLRPHPTQGSLSDRKVVTFTPLSVVTAVVWSHGNLGGFFIIIYTK